LIRVRFPPIDFDDFHRRILPARISSPSGRVATRDLHGVVPLAFRFPDGRAYRLAPTASTIAIDPTDDAPTVVDLDESAWSDFVHELATAAGLVYSGRARFERGAHADLERWEPALRALFSDRPIFDPAAPPPADPHRSFTLDAQREELRHALDANGFALVKHVFRPVEVTRLADTVERFRTMAAPGDGRSWWATRADGTRVVCRLIYLGLAAPDIAALSDDERVKSLASLASEPLRPVIDRADGHSVVIKHPGVVDGLSDLPWHRDCGLGGHPVTCPAINIGLQLDAATPDAGQLHFVPGTARYSCHRPDLGRAHTVAVDTEPGDCTVHLGDVMHAAPPPSGAGPGRRALYVTFMPARAFEFIPAGQSYNDAIRARLSG